MNVIELLLLAMHLYYKQ